MPCRFGPAAILIARRRLAVSLRLGRIKTTSNMANGSNCWYHKSLSRGRLTPITPSDNSEQQKGYPIKALAIARQGAKNATALNPSDGP